MVESFSKRADFDELVAAFVDRGVAVPGEVGGQFAGARRRIGIGRTGARRLAAAQQPPQLGLADGDVAGRQVQQHLRARERGVARRRHRHPDVFADLDMEGHAERARRTEQHVGAERRVLARELDPVGDRVGAGDEMALLVELAVVGQEDLRHHAEDLAAMDHDRGVVEPVRHAQRRADHQHREQRLRGLDDLGDQFLDLVEQRILQQQILDRVGRQSQLGKDHDRRTGLVALGGKPERLAKIVGGVGDPRARHAAGDAHELVGVERIKIGDQGIVSAAVMDAARIEPAPASLSRQPPASASCLLIIPHRGK